jgi:hypothetical protein
LYGELEAKRDFRSENVIRNIGRIEFKPQGSELIFFCISVSLWWVVMLSAKAVDKAPSQSTCSPIKAEETKPKNEASRHCSFVADGWPTKASGMLLTHRGTPMTPLLVPS